MDRSKVKEIVEANLHDLKCRFGLHHWDITATFDLHEDDGGSRFTTRARCLFYVDYEKAEIRFNPDELDTDDDVLEALRHELFHLILAPFHIAWDALRPVVEADELRCNMARSIVTHATERAVKGLERLYHGLTHELAERDPEPCPPPPSSAPAAPA